jgi:hypothetical protein
MTELACAYGDNRDAAIVAFLYDEPDASPAERTGFEAHLRSCAQCRADVADLRGVRAHLGRWSPPEPNFSLHDAQSSSSAVDHPQSGTQQWWRAIPAWAQVAAALLFLGVSAAIANFDVQYNQSGLSIRTGWSARPSATASAPRPSVPSSVATAAQGAGGATDAPWRADLTALERQLKVEIHAAQTSSSGGAAGSVRTVSSSVSEADITRRVRAIVEDSEKRQQRELALRLAELFRDVTAQRQADMVKIDRTLGLVQNNVGIEVMKTREKMNQMDLIYRASQRQ